MDKIIEGFEFHYPKSAQTVIACKRDVHFWRVMSRFHQVFFDFLFCFGFFAT